MPAETGRDCYCHRGLVCEGSGEGHEGRAPLGPTQQPCGLFINQESAPSWAHYQLSFSWHCWKMLISIWRNGPYVLSPSCPPSFSPTGAPSRTPIPALLLPGRNLLPLVAGSRAASSRSGLAQECGGRRAPGAGRMPSLKSTYWSKAPKAVGLTGGGKGRKRVEPEVVQERWTARWMRGGGKERAASGWELSVFPALPGSSVATSF